jgi:putative DNA primase/helicase
VTAAEISFRLHGRKSGPGYLAKCPAHDDDNPSLSLRDADGLVLVHCHAGCAQDAVIAALKDLGLWPEREQRPDGGIEAVYDYTDEAGELLYQIVRKPGKKFLQRYPDGSGGWVWKKHPHQVLYRLREVLENPIIFLVEGERDCETLRDFGFCATTNAGGAKASWLPQFTEALRGREIILIPDNDAPGRQRVLTIARALTGHVAKLVILTLEDPRVKDISDWFAVGHSEVELISMLDGEEVPR